MSERPIVRYPDQRLRARAAPIADLDAALGELIDDLRDTLAASGGIGLSAPQIGVSRRAVVLDVGGSIEALLNPTLQSRAGVAITLESCLSLPGIQANVMRAAEVRVAALDTGGRPVERTFSGMPAVCLQHELDHLDGRLFIDRVSWPRRLRFRSRLAALAAAVSGPAAVAAQG